MHCPWFELGRILRCRPAGTSCPSSKTLSHFDKSDLPGESAERKLLCLLSMMTSCVKSREQRVLILENAHLNLPPNQLSTARYGFWGPPKKFCLCLTFATEVHQVSSSVS